MPSTLDAATDPAHAALGVDGIAIEPGAPIALRASLTHFVAHVSVAVRPARTLAIYAPLSVCIPRGIPGDSGGVLSRIGG